MAQYGITYDDACQIWLLFAGSLSCEAIICPNCRHGCAKREYMRAYIGMTRDARQIVPICAQCMMMYDSQSYNILWPSVSSMSQDPISMEIDPPVQLTSAPVQHSNTIAVSFNPQLGSTWVGRTEQRNSSTVLPTTSTQQFIQSNRFFIAPSSFSGSLTTKAEEPKLHPRKTIPQRLRKEVWNTFIGEEIGRAKCLCCRSTDITPFEFECGHKKSVARGGSDDLSNLRPICRSCNRSMGTDDFDAFSEMIQKKNSWTVLETSLSMNLQIFCKNKLFESLIGSVASKANNIWTAEMKNCWISINSILARNIRI